MRVRRISYLGVRTESFNEMTAFARDVLGLTPGHLDPGWAVLGSSRAIATSSRSTGRGGTTSDCFRPRRAARPPHFAVDDLLEARAELVAAGIEIVADTVWASEAFGDPAYEGFGWLFFRAPDGNVYALQQERPPR